MNEERLSEVKARLDAVNSDNPDDACEFMARSVVYVHDLLAEVTRLRDEARWIPTSEGHPITQYDMFVVLQVDVIPEPLVDIGVYENGGWAYRSGEPIEDDNTTVTHWRAMPSPPDVQ